MTNLSHYFTAEQINKLNCMNYQVSTSEGHYYLQCGIESLERFSKQHQVRFMPMLQDLLGKGYFTLADNDTEIAMI